MGIIGRIFGLLIAASIGAALVAAAAALAMKQRLPRVTDPDADDVHLVAVFEPLAFSSRATSFRGGTVDAWYGGGVVDLREATLDPAGAALTVRTVLGGLQLVVPDSWRVSMETMSIFGGVADTRSSDDRAPDAPHLTLDGLAILGGVGITSEVSDKAMAELRQAVAEQHAAASADPGF